MRGLIGTDLARYGTSRFRKVVYLGAFLAVVAWLVLCRVALAIWPAQRLAELFGERFYNGWVAANGIFPCLVLIVAVVALDVLLQTAAMVVRPLRADRPLARRLAVPMSCALALGAATWWACTRLDPVADHLWAPLADEQTQYARGYSDRAFAEIVPGMSWDEVIARLGPALDEGAFDDGYIVRYSRGIESSSYWRRVIVYDRKGGTVLRVITGLFVS